MDVRTRLLTAAEKLLSASDEADVQTRDVCAAAGVGPPALYRQFGDKEGLLGAVVDFGFEQYLESKRALEPTDDAVADLRTGWDNHTAFAVANPNIYRLLWSLRAPPHAAAEAHRMLLGVCSRAAAQGRLITSAEAAAQTIMSANAGAALSCIARPEQYPDTAASERLRDVVIDGLTVPRRSTDPDLGMGAGSLRAAPRDLARAAATLAALVDRDTPAALHPAERHLLNLWLTRLSTG